MHKRLSKLVLCCLMLLLVAAPAMSADSWLYAIDGVRDPHGVAMAPGGNLLVSSPTWNVIHLMDARGQKIRDFHADYPSAIASDAAGRIYVGVGKYSTGDIARQLPGEVKIFDADMKYIKSLGKGPGEFVMPSSVAVVGSTRILVADMAADNVKVFDYDGNLLLTIGQHGVGDKSFNMPQAVAVDPATGFIYVADRQLVANTYGATGTTPGARVQVFNDKGEYQSGFGSLNTLRSPSGIAFRNNRVFVSDSYLDAVVVFSSNGTFVGNLVTPGGRLSVAGALAVSADGLLYVSGDRSNNVNVFGVDTYMSFDVTPRALVYDTFVGNGPSGKNVVIENKGTQNVQWSAASSVAWAVPGQLSGDLATGQSAQLALLVDPAGMAPGTYQGKADVSNQNGTVLGISLTLNVKPRPALSVTPATLSFSSAAGSAAAMSAPVTVSLTNASTGAFIQATSDAPWLNASPSRLDAASGNIVLSVNPDGLVAGQYTGHIKVAASDAISSSAVVTVSLTVTSVGTILVESNVAGSAFTITGDNNVSLSGGGSRWVKIGVPDGIYTIVFRPLAGYQKPQDQVLTLSGQDTITFTGKYRSNKQSLKLIVGVGNDGQANTPSVIGIVDASGRKISEFAPFGPEYRGVLNVASGDINGDGLDEVIVGSGSVSGGARIAVFDRSGQPLANADFLAFDSGNGVRVSVGDVDGDGIAEIIAVSGQGSVNAASAKIFKYVDGAIKDTGASAVLYNSAGGATVAAGDFNGDGKAEFMVAPAAVSGSRPILRQLAVDTSAGEGSWKIQDTGVAVKVSASYIAGIAAADLNSDGAAELLVASVVSGSVVSSRIDVYNGDGSPAGIQINLGAASAIDLGAGDVNADGSPEICAAVTDAAGGSVVIRIFRSDGSIDGEIQLGEYAGSVAKIALGKLY